MSALFKTPTTPTPTPPPTMPDANNPAVLAAQRNQIASTVGRAGRSSTILSNASSRAPSSAYQSVKLGAG